jgi:hypothetical protein
MAGFSGKFLRQGLNSSYWMQDKDGSENEEESLCDFGSAFGADDFSCCGDRCGRAIWTAPLRSSSHRITMLRKPIHCCSVIALDYRNWGRVLPVLPSEVWRY